MNITWINNSSARFDGAFITLRSYRAPAGNVRLSMYFSSRAVAALGLQRGERLLVGVDESAQKLAFRPTLFGGNSLKGRDSHSHIECLVTLPIFNMPEPQMVRPEEVTQAGDCMVVPFQFDAREFRGWRSGASLKAVA